MGVSSSMHPACCAAVGPSQKVGPLKAVQENNAAGHQPASGMLEVPQDAPTLPPAAGILHPASGNALEPLSVLGRQIWPYVGVQVNLMLSSKTSCTVVQPCIEKFIVAPN